MEYISVFKCNKCNKDFKQEFYYETEYTEYQWRTIRDKLINKIICPECEKKQI